MKYYLCMGTVMVILFMDRKNNCPDQDIRQCINLLFLLLGNELIVLKS